MQSYAVSVGHNYNRDELSLYVTDSEHIYAGIRHKSFVDDVVVPLRNCILRVREESGRR